ncbi:hypothetical protein C1H46_045714 [Malus baccata]|uniref:Uncharacterized protein n=1 Tax=Malus baccata TaxID=106549 RepID=A0A540K3D7_MALBA|nr:hypothetical protein C1H46_045714 [Malus baccata]
MWEESAGLNGLAVAAFQLIQILLNGVESSMSDQGLRGEDFFGRIRHHHLHHYFVFFVTGFVRRVRGLGVCLVLGSMEYHNN